VAKRKNVKRIDPRYFLDETVHRGLDEGVVKKPFGDTMITHDDYEQSDEPPRDDTGEPPLTQRSQRKLSHDHMLARINDAKLYLQQQEDPVASELSQELDGVIHTMELLNDYFMGDMPADANPLSRRPPGGGLGGPGKGPRHMRGDSGGGYPEEEMS